MYLLPIYDILRAFGFIEYLIIELEHIEYRYALKPVLFCAILIMIG